MKFNLLNFLIINIYFYLEYGEFQMFCIKENMDRNVDLTVDHGIH